MGEISSSVSAKPSLSSHAKESRWIAMRSGSGTTSGIFPNDRRLRSGVGNRALSSLLSTERQNQGMTKQEPRNRFGKQEKGRIALPLTCRQEAGNHIGSTAV